MTQVSDAIAAISGSSSRVRSLVDEVSAASRQQAQGIDEVARAIAQMEKVTQTTADMQSSRRPPRRPRRPYSGRRSSPGAARF